MRILPRIRQFIQRAQSSTLADEVESLRRQVANFAHQCTVCREDVQEAISQQVEALRERVEARLERSAAVESEVRGMLAGLQEHVETRWNVQDAAHQALAADQGQLREEIIARLDARDQTLDKFRAELDARLDAQDATQAEAHATLRKFRAELDARLDAQHATQAEAHATLRRFRAELDARLDAQHKTIADMAGQLKTIVALTEPLAKSAQELDIVLRRSQEHQRLFDILKKHWLHPDYYYRHVVSEMQDKQRLLHRAISLLPPESRVLDLGPGNCFAMESLMANGHQAVGIGLDLKSYIPDEVVSRYPLIEHDYGSYPFDEPFDAIWASHVLEHQPNPQAFIEKMFQDLKDDGWLFVLVPPMKSEVVGGHLNLFNTGLLLYRLVVGGFDCSEAMVTKHGYNVVVFVRKKAFKMPELRYDEGDIERLAPFFPFEACQNFNGLHLEINWKW